MRFYSQIEPIHLHGPNDHDKIPYGEQPLRHLQVKLHFLQFYRFLTQINVTDKLQIDFVEDIPQMLLGRIKSPFLSISCIFQSVPNKEDQRRVKKVESGYVKTIDILDLDYMLQFRNMFEINYSLLIKYEILEKLVTFISKALLCKNMHMLVTHEKLRRYQIDEKVKDKIVFSITVLQR